MEENATNTEQALDPTNENPDQDKSAKRCEEHNVALGPGGSCVLCRRKYQIIGEADPGMGIIGGLVRLVLFVAFMGGIWWTWKHYAGASQEQLAKRQAVHAKLYMKDDCSDCDTMRAWLKKEGVDYEELNLEQYADPLQEIAETCGDVKELPVIDFGGECVSAPLDEDKAVAALNHVADKLAAENAQQGEETATQ